MCVRSLFILLATLVGLGRAEPIPFVESSRCANCHRTIYAQWRASQMANSARDPVYRDLYGLASREDPEWAIACARCHEPRAAVDGRLRQTPVSRNEGVACDFCHRIANVWENADGNIEHTPLDMGSGRRATKFGPLSDARSPFHATQHSEVYDSAVYCSMCHQYTAPNGIATEQQYAQWKQTGLGDAEVYCQTCHMPARPGKVSYVPPTAPFRQEVHQHRFGGGDSPTRLLGSFLVTLDRVRSRTVDVTIMNAVAGHNVPGHAHGLRRLHLVVTAKNASGRVLDSERWTYQRTFLNQAGRPTLYFWQASRVAQDNTIPSGETRTERYGAPRGTSRIVAEVVYQRYPDELIAEFGWRGILARNRTIASDSLNVRR